MRSKKRSKKAGRGSLSNAFINIVGRNMLQNELLLSFLKKETGLKGACFPKLESIPAFDAKEPVISQLFILDCQDVDMKNLWTSIHKMDNPKPSQYFFALCNIEPESGVENKAMANGIQGIFYNNDPLLLISKGVCAILNGDIWYSRKTLKKILREKRSPSHSLAHSALAHLTGREKQVLACIASGYTSQDIANELNISMHTVNTHIYNIYKKINANNRLQATLWATKYL